MSKWHWVSHLQAHKAPLRSLTPNKFRQGSAAKEDLNQTKYGAVVHQSTKILQAGILLLLAAVMITSYDISTETHNPQEKGWTDVTIVTWNLIPYGSVKGHLQQLPRDKS